MIKTIISIENRAKYTLPPLSIESISISLFIYKTEQYPPLSIRNVQLTLTVYFSIKS